MSLAITIDLQDGATTPLLRLGNAIQRGDVRKVMGRAVATQLREKFTRFDEERPNAMGGKRTHFWGQVRRSVQQPELIGGDGVKIAINQVGFAQRLFGGDLNVGDNGTKQWFTLAARAEAYGHRAREFTDLHFVLFRAGLAALVQNVQTSLGGRVRGSVTEKGRTKGETSGGGIFFWLVKHIHQEPDPTVLPPEQGEGSMAETAVTAAEEYLTTLRDRAKGSA